MYGVIRDGIFVLYKVPYDTAISYTEKYGGKLVVYDEERQNIEGAGPWFEMEETCK